MKNVNCGYCGSTKISTDAIGKYYYDGKEYDYEIVICDEKDNGCNHSWSLITDNNFPLVARELLLDDLEKEFNN